jgi:hypothetical protein
MLSHYREGLFGGKTHGRRDECPRECIAKNIFLSRYSDQAKSSRLCRVIPLKILEKQTKWNREFPRLCNKRRGFIFVN